MIAVRQADEPGFFMSAEWWAGRYHDLLNHKLHAKRPQVERKDEEEDDER